MRSARRAASGDRTRERILAAARRVFGARPEAGATMADVARQAGVSRATVHRHFRSRETILRAIDVDPEPDARARTLAAAVELLDRDGLSRLSMDEVAERAGLSRATLYRLFPGKAALFKELIRVHSPLEPIGDVVTRLGDEPPEVVVPALARAVAARLEGRTGLVRSLFLEAAGPADDAAEARDFGIRSGIEPVAAYLLREMAAGRLRPMHPLLALQAFAGALVFHVLTRSFAETLLGFDMPLEEAAVQLAEAWLRAMAPEEEED